MHGTALKMYRWELDGTSPEELHVKEGKDNIQLNCFVRDTAPKMHRWEYIVGGSVPPSPRTRSLSSVSAGTACLVSTT